MKKLKFPFFPFETGALVSRVHYKQMDFSNRIYDVRLL